MCVVNVDVTSVFGVYTEYLKEEVFLGLVQVGRNPCLSLPSPHKHTQTHRNSA